MSGKSEKIKNILDVSIKEFAKKGYELASTNVIAKDAKVSKGLIFKYFKNKENLYIETYKYAIKELKNEYEKFSKEKSSYDFFEFLNKWGLKKLELLYKKPILSKFLLTSLELPEKISQKIQEISSEIFQEIIPDLYHRFSKLSLQDNLPKEKLFQLIIFMIQALGDAYTKQYFKKSNDFIKNKDEILKEWELYLEIIKRGVLKTTPPDNS
ncbi:TetR/AcrR family transcriptional regulator [Thermosipho ferrireducens]|uniref:TetR/AcrR family transcriptional regulator n=1 Tax=Thermosipho ferrireducens TaxID=2571116 RepID=A0ABX7S9L7_9BACT|nr:TetR/AcrR family transcriptional regulator [Thermosipho ferrireducens]QTA38071.1 TetR/AcrR family transcriptional regulator [Thermosipho ferrireducens]